MCAGFWVVHMVEQRVGLLGASSLVGARLITRMLALGYQVHAFSRSALPPDGAQLHWHAPDARGFAAIGQVDRWVCLAPIWVLPSYLNRLQRCGARRVVALSSTSRFAKAASPEPAERATVAQLIDGEQQLTGWAARTGAQAVVLRPTLVYGWGRDKNITHIARFIRRFGFFPVFGAATGLRQPVHVDDVAEVCLAALTAGQAVKHDYNVSGAEVLPYREMVARVFAAMGRRQRLLPVPLWMFRLALAALRWLPIYAHWSASMATRMNEDLVFDHSAATVDLAFDPRAFVLSAQDVPA